MTAAVAEAVKNQSSDELAAIVRQILGEDAMPVGDLIVTKIGRSIGQGTVGIFRVSGHAHSPSGTEEWSAVVKALGESKRPIKELDASGAWRELQVYRSGAFAETVAGVRSAHCYAIQELSDMALLWLEDLSAAPQPP